MNKAEMKSLKAVYIGTKNDRSGNPRRGWAIYDRNGQLVCFYDERYSGSSVATLRRLSGLSYLTTTGRIEVTPGQYQVFMRYARTIPLTEE